MSILQYFKRVDNSLKPAADDSLPDPTGPLSSSVPSKAIELANSKVSWLLKATKNAEESSSQGSRRKPYLMLTSGQKYEVGKWAAEHGVTATFCYYATKYPDLPLTETSTRRFKNLYKDHRRELARSHKGSADGDDAGPSKRADEKIKEFPRKREGRPVLLLDELEHQVQEYVKDFQLMHP